MKIQVINKSKHALPEYATGQSAGMDIRANLDEPIVLKPLQRCLVPTGLYIALPEGFEAQIRPRSGLAIKKGIGVLNSPGTIDADYLGESKRTESGNDPPCPTGGAAGNRRKGR